MGSSSANYVRQNTARSARGRYGEDVAVRYLIDAGMTVIDRNWRGQSGEIDVIALDGGSLVICEVKTRTGQEFGGPFAAVTPDKLERLRALSSEWLSAHPVAIDSVRIDVVGVTCPSRGRAQVEYLAGVQ